MFDLRLGCLCLKVMDIAARGKMYDCFGLGTDRDRRAEHIRLALRNQSRELKSVLGIDAFLV